MHEEYGERLIAAMKELAAAAQREILENISRLSSGEKLETKALRNLINFLDAACGMYHPAAFWGHKVLEMRIWNLILRPCVGADQEISAANLYACARKPYKALRICRRDLKGRRLRYWPLASQFCGALQSLC